MRRTKKKAAEGAAAGPMSDAMDDAGNMDHAGPTAVAAARSGIDRLEYLADIISELHAMSASIACPTLTGLLDLARSEAHQEISRRVEARRARDTRSRSAGEPEAA